jgi:hypothetical protein
MRRPSAQHSAHHLTTTARNNRFFASFRNRLRDFNRTTFDAPRLERR